MKRKYFHIAILLFFFASCATQEEFLNDPAVTEPEPEKYSTSGILHFMYGEIYRIDGNFPYANLEYRRALEYDTSTTILNAIADTYRQMGKIQLAGEYYEKTLQLDPDDKTASAYLADLYMQEQRYDKAIPLLEKQLEETEDNIALLQKLADANRRVKQYGSALTALERLIDKEPGIPWSYIFAAEIMFESGRPAEAAAYLERVIPMIPPNDDLYEFWVRALYEKKDASGLLKALAMWVETRTEKLTPYLLYIDQQIKADNIDRAKEVLSRIGHRWREDAKISYFKGLVAMAEEKPDSVWFYFERADGQPDAGGDLYLHYGIWFWGREEMTIAENIADRAIRRMGKEARWLHMKAMIRAQEKDFDTAEKMLIELLENDPGNVSAKEDLANIYLENVKYDRTDSLYAELLTEYPDHPAILNNYAFTLARMGLRLDDAMQYVNEALKISQNAAYYDTKAWIYYRQNKYRKALRWVKKALEYPDANSEVHYHHGVILQQFDRQKEARTAFEQALKMDTRNEEAEKALEELK